MNEYATIVSTQGCQACTLVFGHFGCDASSLTADVQVAKLQKEEETFSVLHVFWYFMIKHAIKAT